MCCENNCSHIEIFFRLVLRQNVLEGACVYFMNATPQSKGDLQQVQENVFSHPSVTALTWLNTIIWDLSF